MRLSKPKGAAKKTVGVLLDWHEPRILKGISRFAREKEWAMLFDYAQGHKVAAEAGKSEDQLEHEIFGLLEQEEAAMVFTGLLCLIRPQRKSARFLKSLKVPAVALSYADEGLMGDCPRVLLDSVACGRVAAEYFLSLGFRNFLSIGKRTSSSYRERIKGFEAALSGKADLVERAWIGDSLKAASLHNPIEAALRKMPRPVAIFAPSDVSCVHAMRCALELGLPVPEEAAILGADNDELICEHAPVPLSSVDVNFEQLGYEAAALLDRVMQDKAPRRARMIVPPSGVVARRSTSIIAVPDLQVARALRFIWTNAGRTLPVEEVASHAGIPHHALSQRFRQHLQRSIVEEIARSRIEKAKSLLTSGTLPVNQVAQACGFSSPSYFNNVFHEATGMTPRKFRHAISQNTERARPVLREGNSPPRSQTGGV
jgi:LacI family transcriptional regulator